MIAQAFTDPARSLVWALAVMGLVGLPVYAHRVRGRAWAIFGLLILLLSLPGALLMHARIVDWLPSRATPLAHAFFAGSMAAAGAHLFSLVRARLRPSVFRLFVSIPGMAFIAAGALSGIWLLALLPVRALLDAFDFDRTLAMLRWLDLLPFLVAAVSIRTSQRLEHETVRIRRSDPLEGSFRRLPLERHRAVSAGEPDWLRVVQISDPHLGPWQPRRMLQRRIEELVARDPDLVLLTGDFLTMEGMGSPGELARALAPLRALPGQCFACFGNHDHEAEAEVRSALANAGVRLLVDDEAVVATRCGPVQILGANDVARDRRAQLASLLARFPRRGECLRVLLLHDPSAFHQLPPDDVDLVFSGHTHGGQLGLLSFGLDWTVLSRTRWPDHGLFGRGRSRLYVHRGTGFYGFPLRLGVPGELSLLEIETN